MQFAFDLISDLHLDTWNQKFDWAGQATSPHCVVVGDLCRDRDDLVHCLYHLSKCYQAVFYIDGNNEHDLYMNDLAGSYKDLVYRISTIPNVVYLQDNVVVVNGVAIVGTNGWWTFDFDMGLNAEQAMLWYKDKAQISTETLLDIRRAATTDANYMMSSIKRLQTHQDVKKIVVVSHTVPRADLIEHDIDLDGSMRFNVMGNSLMQHVSDFDTQNKIHTWCFGHYHGKVDQVREGVRYVNNCRGRGDSPHSQWVYYPLRITVDF